MKKEEQSQSNNSKKIETDTETAAAQAANDAEQEASATEKAEATLKEQSAKLAAEVEQLKEENKKLQKTVARLQSSADKSDTYLTQLVAMKSDFESYKRRMKLNTEQAKAEGVQSVAAHLIVIADTFEIARKQIADEATLKAFEMLHKQFEETLHGFGVEAMDIKGKPFDHNTMEALSTMDFGEQNKGKVVEVFKNGYTMNGKVIRYAQVVVGA